MDAANRPGKREREEQRKQFPPKPAHPTDILHKSIALAVGGLEAADHDRCR